MQNSVSSNQIDESNHVGISRREFLCALITFPIATHIGSSIACGSLSRIHSHESCRSLFGLCLLAESMHSILPIEYSELKKHLSRSPDLSASLDKRVLLSSQKVASEFEKNEYFVIDGCMFSKSELLLSISLLETKRSFMTDGFLL